VFALYFGYCFMPLFLFGFHMLSLFVFIYIKISFYTVVLSVIVAVLLLHLQLLMFSGSLRLFLTRAFCDPMAIAAV